MKIKVPDQINGQPHGILQVAACLLLTSFSLTAYAQIYTCVDKGRTLTSDRPIPECATQPMREIRPTGVVRVIPAPLTAEQKKQQDAELNQKRIVEESAREQVRKDRALLASYSNVDQIESARLRALQDANEVIANARTRMALLQKDRQSNLEEAKPYQDKPLPPVLKRRIDDTDATISLEEKSMASNQANLDRINQKYDAEKKRFQELSTDAKN